MIDRSDFKNCKTAAAKQGLIIGDIDVAYVLMCDVINDKSMIYTLLFRGCNDLTVGEYDEDEKITYIRQYFAKRGKNTKSTISVTDIDSATNAISFEENRDALVRYIAEIDEAVKRGDLDLKDGYTLKVNIRNKLNEKFNMKEQTVEQRIIVQPKFNHICEYTQKECWLQTKEYAKEHWHLIDDPNYKQR